MRVLRIIDGTSVDGPGFRTSIYFAGCNHQCPGCHNPSSWAFDGGVEMSVDEIMERVIENDMDVTFSGGDPIYQGAQLLELSRRIKDAGKSIWCYTGFLFEELLAMPSVGLLLDFIDVVVDGPFVEAKRNIDLLFRGSENQRIIDVARSRAGSSVVEWESDF